MSEATPSTDKPIKGWRSPLFQSIRPLNRSALAANFAAGISLAALNIPQVLGYARIAGMPFVTGLYTLLLPVIGFAAFASSRYLVVAADSATAAILAGGVSAIAPLGSERYVALASLVALMTAGLLLVGAAAPAWIHRRFSFADCAGRLSDPDRISGWDCGAS